MQLFENISMAFASVRSNKMRSLLTMLGIIIGIAAVIAIVTVGNSMTGSVTDSMSGMGVSNITVTVKQKTSGDTQGTAQGVTLRRFMDETPGESDRITDAMIHDFYAAFPDKVDHFEYTVDVGQETISKYGDPTTTIKASVSGVNHDTLANKDDDSQILYGRWLDDAKDAGRMLACVSEKFVTQAIGGSPQDAIGKSFTLQGSDGTLYTYFIVKLASKEFHITDSESTGVLQRLIESNDLTLYGLSNAVTRHSQDVESYDRASELESIGYSILTMPPRQWSRINRAAA